MRKKKGIVSNRTRELNTTSALSMRVLSRFQNLLSSGLRSRETEVGIRLFRGCGITIRL
ncbi:hypothetical protein ZOSMA_32G00370 [Zostera marina]|uniref:Uncharacterized protein n=1 Tax=Zostera marina TaxID=29655 RepID=A0A0K9P895_ZOSMR|nr:hypothetical protein ZOSMA_32G00370 [Zostera marina]